MKRRTPERPIACPLGRLPRRAAFPCWLAIFMAASLRAEDWPTPGHDNQRSAVTGEHLAPPLVESWSFEPSFEPAPGWPRPVVGYGAYKNKSNVDYDDAYRVTSDGERVYFSASGENRVYALDASSGEVRWNFFTDAAPRLAPVLWEDCAYVGSDDGKVHCFDAVSGKVRWSFDAAPGGEQMLGLGRFGSMRPVRTGVLVEDGIAYFAAGLFPAEGIYLFALDARTGEVRWREPLDGRGNEAPSPQGYLLSDGRSIYVTSRVAPSRWSIEDGSAMPFTTPLPQVKDSAYRYHNGGSYALLWDRGKIVYGQAAILAFDPDREYEDPYGRTVKGERLFHWFNARRIVFRGERAWLATDDHLLSVDTANLPDLSGNECREFEEAYKKHRVAMCREGLEEIAAHGEGSERGRAIRNGTLQYSLPLYEEWPAAAEKLFARFAEKTRWMTRRTAAEALILAGDVLYAGGESAVLAVDADSGEVLWEAQTGSRVRGLAVSGQRLFVSTIDGKIRCFTPGESGAAPVVVRPPGGPEIAPSPEAKGVVDDALGKESGREDGFALVVGGDVALAGELARRTRFRIKMLEPGEARVAALRRELAGAGWYGGRITVSEIRGGGLPYAPYLFNLVVDGGREHGVDASELLRVTRPYGGVVFIAGRDSIDSAVGREFVPGKTSRGLRLVRGALAGAKNWTHNHASPANRQCSEDALVEGPFGILWYGEPGPRKRIERHATPPMPLVVDGLLFLEGYDLLMAYDVYNGVRHWERWIPGVTRQGLPVGTSNLVAGREHLYAVAENRRCLQLDARSGQTVREYPVPELEGHEHHYWGWIAKVGDTLYGSRADPDPRRNAARRDSNHAVFALDARSGELQWIREGEGIDNDSLAIEEGRFFLVDRGLTAAEEAAARAATVRDDSVEDRPAVDRRGSPIPSDLRKIVALDAATGAELWSKPFNFTDITLDDTVVGSHIGHSVLCMVGEGVLVVSGQGSLGHPYRQYQDGEFARRAIYALDAATGELLWGGRRNYRKRPLLVGGKVYAEPFAWDLKTGEPLTAVNPVNGSEVPVDFLRGYSGCGHLVASGTTLFGNSGAGGMAHYNLSELAGFAPFGNLQLACGTGAVPAGGVFVAPEGRSGCTCATPIHTSLVLYPGRENASAWSQGANGAAALDCLPVRQVSVNLGAPGFRTDAAGRLWLPYAGKGIHGRFREWLPRYQHDPEMFYADSPDLLPVAGGEVSWIYSSGYAGEKDLVFPLLDPQRHPPATYTVRLHFAEPEELGAGERVFDVSLQGERVLEAFDVAVRAGGARRAHVGEFRGIPVSDSLRIALKRAGGELPPVLCGLEIRRER